MIDWIDRKRGLIVAPGFGAIDIQAERPKYYTSAQALKYLNAHVQLVSQEQTVPNARPGDPFVELVPPELRTRTTTRASLLLQRTGAAHTLEELGELPLAVITRLSTGEVLPIYILALQTLAREKIREEQSKS